MPPKLKRIVTILGSIVLLTLPLHVLMSQTGTCTQSDTHTFLAAMFNCGLTAVVVAACLAWKPRYHPIQLGFIFLSVLAAPILIAALFKTTLAGHSLCGAEFDYFGVEGWERAFAPFLLLVLGGFAALVWNSRKRERNDSQRAL
jgi:hypothetical protein